jgi:SpoVK/Ycf46/Vps4 family AAA+-type ATPase
VDWGILAGYEEQKRQIEDTLLLALLHPEVYESIAKGTRKQFASNRPRAVLFEGPPGTGKTTSARVIASQAAVPLVYIPLEAVVSKWYGESEKMLADMLKTCEQFPDGCIIFLDELDALATSRSTEMHEATRRVLGVLLRHLDGFDSTNKRTVVIGATNRKQDLDPALISRFSTSANFGLPNESCRAEILKQYARHLGDAEVLAVAHATPGMAGRDLKDICEQAERRWASKIIRGQAQKGQLPPLREYLEAASQRLRELAGLPDGDIGSYQTT